MSSADSALPSTAAVASGLPADGGGAAPLRLARLGPRDPAAAPASACFCMSGCGGARHLVARIWNGSVVDTENVRGTPSGLARTTERICDAWNGRFRAQLRFLPLDSGATNLRNGVATLAIDKPKHGPVGAGDLSPARTKQLLDFLLR